jgi:osmotically-inducible protein OsmY
MNIYLKLLGINTLIISSIIITGCNNSAEPPVLSSNHIEITDSNVTSNVQQALQKNEQLKVLDITIITTKGDVLITGTVENQDQINQIGSLVQNTEGVHTLHNHLTSRTQ